MADENNIVDTPDKPIADPDRVRAEPTPPQFDRPDPNQGMDRMKRDAEYERLKAEQEKNKKAQDQKNLGQI